MTPSAATILASMKSVSQSARNSPTASLEHSWYLIVAVVVIALTWAWLYYWDRYRKDSLKRPATPQSLFRELCAAHRLSRQEQALLEAIVEREGLEHPAVVFVAPALLRSMAAAGGSRAAEYAELGRKLFGPHV